MRNLTLSLFSAVLIASIGFGWMFDNLYSQYDQTSEEEYRDNISLLEQLGQPIATSLNNIDDRLAFIKQWPKQANYQLQLVALSKFPLPSNLLTELTSQRTVILETDDSIDLHFYLPAHDELLILSAPPILSDDKGSSATRLVFTSLFYLAVLAILLVWLTPLARRLLALRKSAKAFGEGDLNQRVNIGSIAYISDLEVEFNHMAQRIEDLVNDVKLLSSAVSHDLRTPLARIRFGIDTLQEEDDPILRKRFEQRISDNVDEMVELVETLLSYARLDQKMLNINKMSVNLSDIVHNALQHKTEDDIAYEILVTSNVQVFGDLSYLMILVGNLLQNANQYCQGKVRVELTPAIQENDLAILKISDNGDGINIEQRQKILKPFIRGKFDSRKGKEQPKGYGMGLAIVQRILQWHEGKITIDQSPELRGAEFTIYLPQVKQSK